MPLAPVQYRGRRANPNPTAVENFSSTEKMFFQMATQNPARILPGNLNLLKIDPMKVGLIYLPHR